MKNLIADRIFKTEEEPLSDADLSILGVKRKNQLIIFYSGFIPLAAVLLYVLYDGISVIENRSRHKFSEEDTERFYLVVPYVCGFCFLLLTGYFIYYYIRMLEPIIKDLKKKKKLLVHFIPEKTEMAFFGRFYLSSPVLKKRLVQVTYEDFCIILNGDPIILELAPHSRIMLRFTYNGKEIKVT